MWILEATIYTLIVTANIVVHYSTKWAFILMFIWLFLMAVDYAVGFKVWAYFERRKFRKRMFKKKEIQKMTNAEKYTGWIERLRAWDKLAEKRECEKNCKVVSRYCCVGCAMRWLDAEADEEPLNKSYKLEENDEKLRKIQNSRRGF